MPQHYDLTALRSFVAGIDLGSFSKAADRVGRSTSAISAQIKKLEEQAGVALFRKAGRGLALTEAGEILLGYARRLLALNDEAHSAMRGIDLEGWVRLGLQEDFGEALLPDVLGRFARAHAKVRINARIGRNAELSELIATSALDLALLWSDGSAAAPLPELACTIARPAMRWIASPAWSWSPASGEPLPLLAFDRPCLFHNTAMAALDRAGIPWRIAFTSPSLAGIWAAAAAGLGIAIRTPYGMPATLRTVEASAFGLPELPVLALQLVTAAASPAAPIERIASLMVETLGTQEKAMPQVNLL